MLFDYLVLKIRSEKFFFFSKCLDNQWNCWTKFHWEKAWRRKFFTNCPNRKV